MATDAECSYDTKRNNPNCFLIITVLLALIKAVIPDKLNYIERIRMFTGEESCAATKVYGEQLSKLNIQRKSNVNCIEIPCRTIKNMAYVQHS